MVLIRKMECDDADDLVMIHQKCDLSPWTKASFDNEYNNILADYFIMEEDEKVIGYAGMWCVIDEAQVMNVAVLPEYRKKGLGTRLIEKMCEAARNKGCVSIVLEVKESNQAARTLYAHCGFYQYAHRKKYYPDGSDALLLKKDL